MSIEERLRTGLALDGEPPPVDDALVGTLVDRARRRHQIRVGVGAGVAAVVTAIALAVAPQVRWNQSDREPPIVEPRTTTSDTESFVPQTSPIDGKSWFAGLRAGEALRTLDGTGLSRYGPSVLERLSAAELEFAYGEVTIRSGHLGQGGTNTWTGEFELQGKQLVLTASGLGTSAYTWRLDKDDRLHLDLTSVKGGEDVLGAPTAVFLRMGLTSHPFVKRLGY